MDFAEERKSSKRVFEAKNLVVLKPNGEKILDGINLIITSGERVALIGSNGSGKSTFVKTLLGKNELPVSGEIFVGPSVKVGYLSQIIEFDNDKLSLLECFKQEACVNEQKARQILASFQFYKEDVNKKVKNLSGGERIRLRLASLLQQNVNCLVLTSRQIILTFQQKKCLKKQLMILMELLFLFHTTDIL